MSKSQDFRQITAETAGKDLLGALVTEIKLLPDVWQKLSKATRLLIDSVIAEAISYVSGIKTIMVDEFDLFDIPTRSAYLNWLIDLAESGEIETALLFGTLKKLPSGMSFPIHAYWLQDGVIAQDSNAKVAS